MSLTILDHEYVLAIEENVLKPPRYLLTYYAQLQVERFMIRENVCAFGDTVWKCNGRMKGRQY